jgi:arginyl-tRNA synthetase
MAKHAPRTARGAMKECKMAEIRDEWRELVAATLEGIRREKGIDSAPVEASAVSVETPPDPAMGDLGFPMFAFAKAFRMGPPQIAIEVAKRLAGDGATQALGTAKAVGPYTQRFLAKGDLAGKTLSEILAAGTPTAAPAPSPGSGSWSSSRARTPISPCTSDTSAHDALGESVSRILAFCGPRYSRSTSSTTAASISASRCSRTRSSSMARTPESRGVKSDRFVGDCYVRFNDYAKENPEAAEAERRTSCALGRRAIPRRSSSGSG